MLNNKPSLAFCVSSAMALTLLSAGTEAKKARPSDIDEMWRIIEQQQKQIEELKTRITQNETAKPGQDQQKSAASAQGDKKSTGPTATAGATPKTAKSDSERKTDILASEVEKLKTQLHIPDKREYKVEYGYGPAASEVYRVNRGLSIGGYGEWAFSDYSKDLKSTADNMRAVIYAGYKFNDWIILNNEFEFEHGTTGEGSEQKGEVSVEFSYLDFMLKDYANVRAGLTLVPMGFINEIHEGPTFHGNYRPQVERVIIPTTWREIGAGVWGEITPGLQYRMYGMNGLNAEGFSSEGIREGRQSGSKAIAEDFAFTGRIDYDMPFAPGLLAGASAWVGNSGQGYQYSSPEFGAQQLNVLTQLYEGHIQWHWQGLEMRALGAVGSIGNAAQLSAAKGQTIGSQNYGWYTEAAYNLMPWLWKDSTQYIAPFFRYESYNTLASVPDGFDNYGGLYDQWIYQGGLTYKPIENVAVKFDYRNFNSAAGTLPSQYNIGVAFMY
jgi:hypothetical protein